MEHTTLPHSHPEGIQTLSPTLPDAESFSLIAEIFKLLGDGTRVRLFWLLCHCEDCLINLAASTEMSSPALSHHLKLLKAAGLVSARREGKEVYYKATDTERAKALHEMIERVAGFTCPQE